MRNSSGARRRRAIFVQRANRLIIERQPQFYGEGTTRFSGIAGSMGRIVLATAMRKAMERRLLEGCGPLTGDGPVVSMTTFGPRARIAHLAIESIGAGIVRPRRLILWVDDPAILGAPSRELMSQIERGLELLPARPFGPHTKYFPAVDAGISELVTADDDILYPEQWLRGLSAAADESGADAIGWRGRRMRTDGLGLAPSSSWGFSRQDDRQTSIFLTGVSGVYYRSRMVEALRVAGTGFMAACPKADDIWLNHVRHESGLNARLAGRRSMHFPQVPGSQSSRLGAINVDDGGNDRYLKYIYSSRLLESLALEDR